MTVRAALLVGTLALTAVTLAPGAGRTPEPPRHVQAPLGTDLTVQDLVMAANGCGTERWAGKTASDPDRNLVSTTQHQTTIDALKARRAPSSLPSNNRVRPTELTEYVIAGNVEPAA